jgi:hypothetical protein
MSFVLMMVGILATALGAILIGFGIPINEFSLGNTLILAGTVTAMGGLIVLAVSRAVSQLTRIADLMATRPVAAPAMPMSSASAVPPPAPRAPQSRAQHGDEFGLPEKVEAVRPPPRAVAPAAEEPAAPAPAPTRPGWRPPRPSVERPAKPATPPDPRRPTATAQPTGDNPFDTTWPDKSSASSRREPSLETPSDAAPAGRPEAVTVLKSGVVDGMAYTLYTDGSIEAELAQGVVRFGSIEELRNHLEKSA